MKYIIKSEDIRSYNDCKNKLTLDGMYGGMQKWNNCYDLATACKLMVTCMKELKTTFLLHLFNNFTLNSI